MRIGLDAKWFYTGPVSTRTVLQNLLPELFKKYPHEWIIFLDRKDRKLGFPYKQNNILLQYVWAEKNLLSNVFIVPAHAKRLKTDVLVYQTFPSFRRSIPSIAFIHDVLFRDYPQFFTWKERLYFKPLSWLAPKANRLIATTGFVANELVKYSYAKNSARVDIVPLAVSASFKPKELQDYQLLKGVESKFGLPDNFILYVGRLNTRKNIEALLKALPGVHDENICLVIVGEADWKTPDLKKLVADMGIQKRILFTGSVDTLELQAIYALAKIFCFPSFAEGFGLPPLEAMASGVPVIVAGTTALPEVCGDAALYIDPDHPASITTAVNLLLENPEHYQKMRKAGIERAAAFTWERTAEKFMESILHTIQNR